MNRNSCQWFFCGLAAGAAAGLLAAPMSGARSRAMIAKKAKRASADICDAVDRGKDAVARTQDSVLAAVDRGKEAVSRTQQAVSDAVDAGRKALRV